MQAGTVKSELELPNLSLRELPDTVLLRLHSLEEPAVLAAGLARAGLACPLTANEAAGQNPAVVCLRPGEWLLIGHHLPAAELIDRISGRLDPSLTALLDLSDGLGVLRLSGPASPWLLGKLSGLDFLAGISSGQHGASTRVGEIAVVLHFRPDPNGNARFDLIFDRSVARYLWDLLEDAAPHAEELLTRHGAAA
jgi:heterotetrameric sarcosine oxidase gamma subunit